MRVLLVSHVLPGDARPGANRITWFVNAMSAHGVETRLLVLRAAGTKKAGGTGRPADARHAVVETSVKDVPGAATSLLSSDGGFARVYRDDPALAEAVAAGRRVVDEFAPDLVMASTPALRNVEVGFRLSVDTGVPLVIDWRDPGVLRPLRVWSSRPFFEAVREREKEWVARTALHIVTARSCGAQLARHYPGARAAVVTNACEAVAPPAEAVIPVSVLYSGSMIDGIYGFASGLPVGGAQRMWNRLTGGRLYHVPHAGRIDYRPWGRAAIDAMARHGDRIARMEFLGARTKGTVRRLLKRARLWSRTHSVSWVRKAEAQAAAARAHVLWLCLAGTNATEGEPVIASKVFDYLASGRPVFAAVPPTCETAEILRAFEGTFVPDPSDPAATADAFLEALSQPPGRAFPRDMRPWGPGALAARMAEALAGAVAPA